MHHKIISLMSIVELSIIKVSKQGLNADPCCNPTLTGTHTIVMLVTALSSVFYNTDIPARNAFFLQSPPN